MWSIVSRYPSQQNGFNGFSHYVGPSASQTMQVQNLGFPNIESKRIPKMPVVSMRAVVVRMMLSYLEMMHL